MTDDLIRRVFARFNADIESIERPAGKIARHIIEARDLHPHTFNIEAAGPEFDETADGPEFAFRSTVPEPPLPPFDVLQRLAAWMWTEMARQAGESRVWLAAYPEPLLNRKLRRALGKGATA